MPVGEVFLGAFLQVLFDRLAPHKLSLFPCDAGTCSKLKRWKNKLLMIQAVLNDAEDKKLTNEAVKTWLEDLQDLAYDVDDILDEYATQVLERQMRDEKTTNSFTDYLSSLPSALISNSNMVSKIEAITDRLEDLCDQRDYLGLEKVVGGTSPWQRPPTTCVPTEPATIGRDEDRAKILEMVLTEEPRDASFRVIPIVGMGGLGKTTLARQVFIDNAVKHFNSRAWVCISDDFDVLKISKGLLESITSKSCDLKDLNAVQVQLKNEVAGKKFLLVLDDIWNDKYNLWEILKSPFMAGASGSKIIVTTRSVDVALTMEQSDYYNLKHLTDEACWNIFKMHVSGNKVIADGKNLNFFRQRVFEKCRGLPLAARTLGSLLRTKPTDDEWKDILTSEIWDLSADSSDILPVLKLSYNHLPSHLKRCFAYCAIFPKDYEFAEIDLIQLWMAEGFIKQPKSKELEDVGKEYFRDLLSRSIFQKSTNDVSKFVMHDLLNDLAQSISRDTSFIFEDELSLRSERFQRIRHSSYSSREYEVENRFEVFHKIVQLRTFLSLSRSTPWYGYTIYAANTILLDLLPKLKKLRVLSLPYYSITELPNSIGGHLRYLDLSYTKIRCLPEPISSLYNLQILKLRCCPYLKKLPFNMENLINLRCFDISESSLVREMPLGVKKLKCLRMLSNFIVGKNSGSSLKELRELKFLNGKLVISSLENMIHSEVTRETILSDKKKLEVLVLKWGSNFDISRDVIREENVLKMLQPHENLKELTIENYCGKIFPQWVGDKSFSKMAVLQLDGCINCITLPSLVLLVSLKNLTIKNMKNVNKIGPEIYGRDCSKSFQSLEILCFDDLPEWEHGDPFEENDHIERFPHLQELSISKCPKLPGRLPTSLPLLKKLVVDKCDQLVVSLSGLSELHLLEINRCKGIVWHNPNDSKSLGFEACEKLNFMVFKNCSAQGFPKVDS